MGVLRTIAFWIAVVLWTLVLLSAACALSALTLGLLRHRLINLFAPLYGWPLLWIAGIRMEVRGREHIAVPAARIVAFNHNSFLEVLLLSAVNVPRFSFLGKRSFLFIPILGQTMWLLGGHFVDRGNRRSAVQSLRRLGDALRRHGLSTLIAPEGTRSRTGRLQPFKLGPFHLALDTRAPIVPLVFHGVHDLLPPDDWRLGQGTVHIEFHPPIDTTDWTREELHARAEALHADFARWLEAGPAKG